MLIKEDERNCGKWKIGIVDQLVAGLDGVVRAAKLRAGNSNFERALQQLYPLELKCEQSWDWVEYECRRIQSRTEGTTPSCTRS